MCVIQRHELISCVSYRDTTVLHVCHREKRQYYMCDTQRHKPNSCVSYRDTTIVHVCHKGTRPYYMCVI